MPADIRGIWVKASAPRAALTDRLRTGCVRHRVHLQPVFGVRRPLQRLQTGGHRQSRVVRRCEFISCEVMVVYIQGFPHRVHRWKITKNWLSNQINSCFQCSVHWRGFSSPEMRNCASPLADKWNLILVGKSSVETTARCHSSDGEPRLTIRVTRTGRWY